MPRKKKKEKLTIQSSETRILVGIILFILGLTVGLSSFIHQDSPLFDQITLKLGYSSISWGLFLTYISLFLLVKSRKFKSIRIAVGFFLFSLCLSTLLSFWQTTEQLNSTEALKGAGGELGKLVHLGLNGVFGNLIEIIIVLVLLVLSFSLITGTTLEQIMEFIETPISKDDSEKKGFDWRSIFPKSDENQKEPSINIYDGQDRSDDDIPIVNPINQEPRIQNNISDEYSEVPLLQENIHIDNQTKIEDRGPQTPKYTNWVFPSIDVLQDGEVQKQDNELFKKNAKTIEQTLKSFGIPAKVAEIAVGPTVLRFSLGLTVGTKVSKVKNLSNDLALALASRSSSVRVEAPIPGTSYVGIEIPNPTPNYVYTKDMIKRLRKEVGNYELPLILGKDITGKTAIRDLAKIPHLLVAGATGTGKSVAINSLITGLLMTKTPDEVKFIMIDPKMGVEMAAYNGIPHLLNPVITDNELVVGALVWTIEEMMRRYRQLKQVNAKKLTEYNKKLGYTAMPYIVIVIDEMADLMLTSRQDVESKIQRLAQMGRAVGIHLILATQKPVVEVITGLIKANVPGRMAFAVTTSMDSRVILDEVGAETLLGNGDMLFKDQTTPKPLRIQGTYTPTEDTENVISAIKEQIGEGEVEYSEDFALALEKPNGSNDSNGEDLTKDPDFVKALEIIIANKKASSSFLQRKMKIGYNKAARFIDEMYDLGVIGPQDGAKPRQVLISSLSQVMKTTGNDSDLQE